MTLTLATDDTALRHIRCSTDFIHSKKALLTDNDCMLRQELVAFFNDNAPQQSTVFCRGTPGTSTGRQHAAHLGILLAETTE